MGEVSEGGQVNCLAKHPKKKAGSRVIHHAKILRDAERVKQLMRAIPGYRPSPQDAPHLLGLIRAAVRYVNSLPPHSRAKSFLYEGTRYPLLFTTLGRVIVCDKDGTELVASGYGAIH